MGIVSTEEFAVSLLLWGLLSTVFVAWVLKFVWQTTAAVGLSPTGRKRSQSSEISDVLCPCIFEDHCSAFQLTLCCTVVSVAFFFLAHVFCTLWSIVLLAVCHNCSVALVFNYLDVFCMAVGYVMMLTTHFERLRLTFNGTAMQLPQWAPTVLYADLLLGIVLIACINAFRHFDSRVSALCSLLLTFAYFVSVFALTRAFYKKTMAIATKCEDRNDDLKETAVRMTMVSTMSVVSSTVTMLLWVAMFVVCPNCLFWRLLGNILLSLDHSFTAFCLMCTFAPAVGYYKCVFGRLHNWLLARVAAARMLKSASSLSTVRASNDKLAQSI